MFNWCFMMIHQPFAKNPKSCVTPMGQDEALEQWNELLAEEPWTKGNGPSGEGPENRALPTEWPKHNHMGSHMWALCAPLAGCGAHGKLLSNRPLNWLRIGLLGVWGQPTVMLSGWQWHDALTWSLDSERGRGVCISTDVVKAPLRTCHSKEGRPILYVMVISTCCLNHVDGYGRWMCAFTVH